EKGFCGVLHRILKARNPIMPGNRMEPWPGPSVHSAIRPGGTAPPTLTAVATNGDAQCCARHSSASPSSCRSQAGLLPVTIRVRWKKRVRNLMKPRTRIAACSRMARLKNWARPSTTLPTTDFRSAFCPPRGVAAWARSLEEQAHFYASAVARFPLLALVAAPHLAERPFEIGEICVGHARMEGREHEVKPFRLGRQAREPAALEEFAPDGEGVHFIMGEGDDAELRATEHAEAELRNARFNRLARIRHLFVFRAVAFLAEKLHHRPGSRNRDRKSTR